MPEWEIQQGQQSAPECPLELSDLPCRTVDEQTAGSNSVRGRQSDPEASSTYAAYAAVATHDATPYTHLPTDVCACDIRADAEPNAHAHGLHLWQVQKSRQVQNGKSTV
jgi:hypothetical protein